MTGLRQLLLSATAIIFFLPTLFGQGVSNVDARIDGQNPNVVNITYDLAGQASERFKIEIFRSGDNFQSPLQRVSGDVGDGQAPGRGKLIIWQAREELGFFTGDISFEVRSTVTFSQLRITTPTATSVFKPGTSMPIRWTGGASGSNLKLELYRSNTRSRDIGTTPNSNSFSWTVPSDLPKGADYSVRMFDTADPANITASSPSFTIKSAGGGSGKKIAFIGLGVAAVGAGVALALGGGDDGGTTPPPATNGDSDPLPTPPDPSSGIMGKIAGALLTIRIGN